MGCTMGIVKYLVYIFNLILAFSGLALLIIGIIYKLNLGEFDAIKNKEVDISIAPTIAIVLGSIIFIISFLGCCGSIRENSCMLTMYAVIVLVILALQIAAGVYAFISVKDETKLQDEITKSIRKSFEKYTNDDKHESFDLLQSTLKCCGVGSSRDWLQVSGFNGTYPASCCDWKDDKETGKCPNLFEEGCASKAYDQVTSNIKTIGYVALGLCATEVVASIFALCLVSSIKNNNRRGTY